MIELRRIIVGVDEREPLKFVLIDRTNHVDRNWRQNWLFFRELGIEIQRVFLIFLFRIGRREKNGNEFEGRIS